MLVILPMHHRSPIAAGTVPTSGGGALAELAESAFLGAVIAHPPGGHDAQLHVHGTPEAVSKVTASIAPAAAMGHMHCAAYRMGTGECAPLTVGVAVVGGRVGASVVGTAVEGAAAQAQSVSRRREGSATIPLSYRSGQPPSEVAAYCVGAVIRTDGRTVPRGAQKCALPFTNSGGTRRGANVEYGVSTAKYASMRCRSHNKSTCSGATHCAVLPDVV
jgi:hypothetical protein